MTRAAVAPGTVLADRYRVDTPIGSGGMGAVWSATDLVLARRVAIKILHPSVAARPGAGERFRSEALAAARLSHPNIVRVHDVARSDDLDLIVMEFVEGRTLRSFLDERGRLDPEEVVHIGTEVGAALSVAHRAGIVHCDVTPANILLSDDGRVLLTDFGIARILDGPIPDGPIPGGPILDRSDPGRPHELVGTPRYLSPEQRRGAPVDGRADVHALASVLLDALRGPESPPVSDRRGDPDSDSPFDARTDLLDLLERARAEDPDSRPDAATFTRWLHSGGFDLSLRVESDPVRSVTRGTDHSPGPLTEAEVTVLSVDETPSPATRSTHRGPTHRGPTHRGSRTPGRAAVLVLFVVSVSIAVLLVASTPLGRVLFDS